MTDHDTEHKGIIMTITEDADMDPKPYTLTAISIGLEGAATGMALAGGHWLLSLLFLLLTVLFAINGWRPAAGRACGRPNAGNSSSTDATTSSSPAMTDANHERTRK